MQDRINLFVIEDDYQDALILKELLNSSQDHIYEIEHADELGKAILRLESKNVDLIITDLGLPDSVQLDTLNTLLENFYDIPIIVLTGSSDTETGNMAVSMGAQDYHFKGQIQRDSLIRSIHYAIERKKSELRLKDSELRYKDLSLELKETNNLKELLLDVVTHDLKNYAGSIYTLAEDSYSKNTNDTGAEIIKEASSNILGIIKNTAALSRITSGEQIKYEEINLQKLLAEVLKEYDVMLSRNGFALKLCDVETITLRANPIISEIFRNYISNALVHASKGKYLEIKADIQDEQIICRFIDRGDQIEKVHRKAIFQRRYQVNHNTSRGSGLGLAIAKRIAVAHNGNAWVEPHDNGNCFCFSMPHLDGLDIEKTNRELKNSRLN